MYLAIWCIPTPSTSTRAPHYAGICFCLYLFFDRSLIFSSTRITEINSCLDIWVFRNKIIYEE